MDFTLCQKKCSLIGVNANIVDVNIQFKAPPSRGLEKMQCQLYVWEIPKSVVYLPTKNTPNV